MKRSGAALRHQLLPWLLPLLLLLGWQAGASLGWISSRVLPAPLDVGRAFIRLSASGELARHLQISCGRALAGFVVGAAVGLLLGFLTGTSRTLPTWWSWRSCSMPRWANWRTWRPRAWNGAGCAGSPACNGRPPEMRLDDFDLAVPHRAAANQRGVAVAASGLTKSFGAHQVLRRLDLRIDPGAFVAIVGRSGCGKSTLLRLLAGLDEADTGAIQVDGVARRQLHDDTRVMFQEARLLPWKTVLANVGLNLPGDWRPLARAALTQVGLAERAHDWPWVLSGGQRQRVALARALVHSPRLLLLDEPLGALEALTRIEMQDLIARLWQAQGFTALLVTHDVCEAVVLADRVVVIEAGAIALDLAVPLPRPRERGNSQLAALEGQVLQRLLAPGAGHD